jgi:hypothetical protein
MGNWHLVVAYDTRATDWLAAEGYRHPVALPHNRLPSEAEIEAAVATLGLDHNDLVIDSVDSDSFRVRGDLVAELRLLRLLCEHAGQLWVYPDCGSPAMIVDSTIDPEAVAASWLKSLETPDPWIAFLGMTGEPSLE